MPRLPISEQALRLALTRPVASRPSQYVCRACVRQYHPSPALRAELPFWKRMTNSLFGSSEDKAAAEKRDEAHQTRLNELAEQGGGKTETFVDDQGREWTIAAIVDPSINKEYVQAQRWDGLEWVGSKEWIARKNDGGEQYVGWNPKYKLDFENQAEWARVLQHVLVEVLALAQAGRDVNAVHTERSVRIIDWHRTANVQVKVKDGAIELQLPENESMDNILKAIPRNLAEEIAKIAENAESTKKERSAAKKVTEKAEEEVEDGAPPARRIKHMLRRTANPDMDNGWFQVPLADSAIKLAIVKRVQRLTGRRIRDSVVSSATTMQDLYRGLRIKQPQKLSATDELKKVNVDLRNVTVHGKRQTPIHKHMEVGRWKVIEEELINRNLPITGSRYQGAKTTSPSS